MRAEQGVLLFWAGLATGGNLIAAPAKFQVDILTTAELLQVGRAQFAWLGWAEWACLAVVLCLALMCRAKPAFPVLVGLLVFLIQQAVLHPLLQERSDIVMQGGTVEPSALHLVFIVAELAKVAFLVLAVCQAPLRKPTLAMRIQAGKS